MEKFYLNNDDYEENVESIVAANREYEDKPFPSVVDRYFTRYHYKRSSSNGDNEDHLVLFHSNKVCMIMLDKNHIAFTKGIVDINFDVGNCDRSQNQVKGKHKKGGMNMQHNTCIAIIKCADDSQYKIVSCVQGRLVEVNDRLKTNLSKLNEEGNGYVAVVLLKPDNYQKSINILIDDAAYNNIKS
ncbi:hypothetical protein PVAND_000012 [Polypedilum vanderplanki]|uniref:Protein Abitram n=1 Tax=Polypedilum vanderplanki TaxID=319348 RepID=A0A9J6BIS2_POLVA|nr:hypothetical protein PVAND_000012 [Polypedilum vanderplanki]